MQVELVDNVTKDMASALSSAIQDSRDVRMAVAFVSQRGLAMIEASLNHTLQHGASLEFLVGLDMRTTEPGALRTLYELSQNHTSVALYCFASLEPAAVYHPKLYLSRLADNIISIVGSSNLTEGGLKKNVEVNVAIKGSADDELISDLYGTYNRLKFHPKRVIPDEEFLSLYRELHEREKRAKKESDRDSRKLVQQFTQKAGTLRRPTPTRRDLVGWLDMVYDHLPGGEFSNDGVYAYEAQFGRRYPENLNIRAKIRQQLQVLRDMGFVEHLGRGLWRKV